MEEWCNNLYAESFVSLILTTLFFFLHKFEKVVPYEGNASYHPRMKCGRFSSKANYKDYFLHTLPKHILLSFSGRKFWID